MDGTLFSQVQTLALEIKRLEAAHDQSEVQGYKYIYNILQSLRNILILTISISFSNIDKSLLAIYCLVNINIKIDIMFIPSEARVVRLSQNSDDYKRQVRQLHANIQSLGNVLGLIGPE